MVDLSSDAELSVTMPEPFRSILVQHLRQVRWRAFSYDPRLERAGRYVEAHRDAPLCLAKVASAACLDDKYFSRYFHRQIGMSFSKWIRIMRVCRAAELLAERDRCISEVGRAVGVPNRSTFERNFKKILGVSPAAFKAAVRRDQ